MKPKFDWNGHTPPELIEAVSHLRERFNSASWNVDQVTQRLCYAALHPAEEVNDLLEYERAFNQMKPIVGRSMLERFSVLLLQRTDPAYFAAFFSIREWLLRSQVGYTFQELLAIARVQRHLLSSAPPTWTRAQVQSLIDNESWKTATWLKQVCDVQRRDPDDHDREELIHWRKWRAPMFFVMEPSRYAPFEAQSVWERQDEDTTVKWLDLFSGEVIRGLEKVLNDAVGQAHLAELKRGPIARPTQPTAVSQSGPLETLIPELPKQRDLEFDYTDDYRSLRYNGQTHSLTGRQAVVVQLLYKAHLSGYPKVAKAKLLSAVEAETSEVRSIFKGSPLWNTLVRQASRRGVYRLNLPNPPQNTREIPASFPIISRGDEYGVLTAIKPIEA